MKIKDLYEYNPIVLGYIKNQDFLELKLCDNYKIPLEKLTKYYSVNLDTNQSRYDQAFDICRKILGYDTKLNDITSRAISYLTSKLILPNKLIELYLDKYKTAYKLNNYEDIDVWGAGVNNTQMIELIKNNKKCPGKNTLGKLLMQLREEYKKPN